MELLNVFAMVGIAINDMVAIISVIGSTILFLGSFSKASLKKYGRIPDWSIVGLVLGILFQGSMAITGTAPDLIGMVVRMTPLVVNGLLGLSFLLLVSRWWIRRNRADQLSREQAPSKAANSRMKRKHS